MNILACAFEETSQDDCRIQYMKDDLDPNYVDWLRMGANTSLICGVVEDDCRPLIANLPLWCHRSNSLYITSSRQRTDFERMVRRLLEKQKARFGKISG